MKVTTLVLTILIFLPLSVFATKQDCSNSPYFVKQKEERNYKKVKDLYKMKELSSEYSFQPAQIFRAYFELYESENILCMDIKATRWLDEKTGKKFVAFTTHDDYCDGGNTMGLILDQEAIRNWRPGKPSFVVGEISDSTMSCPDSEALARVKTVISRKHFTSPCYYAVKDKVSEGFKRKSNREFDVEVKFAKRVQDEIYGHKLNLEMYTAKLGEESGGNLYVALAKLDEKTSTCYVTNLTEIWNSDNH